jgi:hypothetical protein
MNFIPIYYDTICYWNLWPIVSLQHHTFELVHKSLKHASNCMAHSSLSSKWAFFWNHIIPAASDQHIFVGSSPYQTKSWSATKGFSSIRSRSRILLFFWRFHSFFLEIWRHFFLNSEKTFDKYVPRPYGENSPHKKSHGLIDSQTRITSRSQGWESLGSLSCFMYVWTWWTFIDDFMSPART